MVPSALIELAENLGTLFIQRGWTLTTVESCTGGGLAYAITSISGSSDWFERSFVTYSDTAKQEMVDVKTQTLQQYGAVSKQTAIEMAAGGLAHSHATVSLSITGIAGPSGGSVDKPVGTVWIAWVGKQHSMQTQHYVFQGNREAIREQAIREALYSLLQL